MDSSREKIAVKIMRMSLKLNSEIVYLFHTNQNQFNIFQEIFESHTNMWALCIATDFVAFKMRTKRQHLAKFIPKSQILNHSSLLQIRKPKNSNRKEDLFPGLHDKNNTIVG